MTTIRTPEDEVDKPGWFYPPFTENWWYQGATYAGHSDASVDWNRRTKNGGWLDDAGDPVLAAADGTVTEVDPRNGLVMLSHKGGYATEYRHMTGPFPKVGEKVQRGDRIGSIGDVAGDGRSIGAHLHHVHYRNGKRIQQSFYGEPVRVSVLGSDSKPASWKAPDPVMVQGPPPRATWESAFREAKRLLDKAEKAAADATTAKGAAESALADEKAAHALTRLTLQAADARIAELEKTPPDCSAETDRALEAERKLDDIRAVLSR
jgi:hypothetical protein